MFLRDQVVKIRHGSRERYVQLESGPFKLAANDQREHYQGWILLDQHDPYGEPLTVCFVAEEAVPATEEEVLNNTQGKLSFRETNF